ncbi:NhaA family Na+:H+ antiporter [Aureimonas jatrophae]|uniref:Na(+)/H(+) antiporter NhaA n=1 Tax=Aureimonas jatrophae TaxID=1166073 RepID=A0A1H0C4U6_9HYPH|nr:Na+/H+ antiporter NhaA [Aureimonas jatrophae]MBB3949067.1 NhaA family Na+:H+ antiporter [Aureimonas jatrophae]SDN52879.1 sodium/proton antiporter, NhaA family [Aureimonas jatrophae]
MPSIPLRRPLSAFRALIGGETGGGIVLMASAALALIVANSPAAPAYFAALSTYLGPLSVLHWINDGLMALFFLLVGLEIKRELLDGQLRSWSDRILPGVAAVGGMAVPALIFAAVNWSSPGTLRGWAIPTATDIAFALGVLALLGSRVPVSLKVFLTALAILDDLGAVVVIALFYTADLSWPMLGAAAVVVAILVAMNRAGVRQLAPYLLLGLALWFFVFSSGVHATIAGVVLALTIPLGASPGRPDEATSPLHRLEHGLLPWSAYLVLPLFGFANAGVSLAGFTGSMLLAPVTLGVALGLFLGKQLGVFATVWLAVRLKLAQRPAGASWIQVYGVALLCGVGFTMSLFIGLLAFASRPELEAETKVGVLVGSLLSMTVGAIVLRWAPQPVRAAGKREALG